MPDRYPFEVPEEKMLFQNLTQTLRCVLCQNQSLAESEAPIAVSLREEIYQQVRAGKSFDNIMGWLEVSYGKEIRMQPSLESGTFVLWFGPVFLLFVAVYFFLRYVRSTKRV